MLQNTWAKCTVVSAMNTTMPDNKIRYDLQHLGVVVVILVFVLILTYILDKQSNILQKAGSEVFKYING